MGVSGQAYHQLLVTYLKPQRERVLWLAVTWLGGDRVAGTQSADFGIFQLIRQWSEDLSRCWMRRRRGLIR